jgi:hypothetical protein
MLNPSVTPDFVFQLQPWTNNPGFKLGTKIEFEVHRRMKVVDWWLCWACAVCVVGAADIYDMIWYDMIWYDMIWYDIYLLTASGLPAGGSCTIHKTAKLETLVCVTTEDFGDRSVASVRGWWGDQRKSADRSETNCCRSWHFTRTCASHYWCPRTSEGLCCTGSSGAVGTDEGSRDLTFASSFFFALWERRWGVSSQRRDGRRNVGPLLRTRETKRQSVKHPHKDSQASGKGGVGAWQRFFGCRSCSPPGLIASRTVIVQSGTLQRSELCNSDQQGQSFAATWQRWATHFACQCASNWEAQFPHPAKFSIQSRLGAMRLSYISKI